VHLLVTVRELADEPLGARRLRREMKDQFTREQVESYHAMVRELNIGLLPVFLESSLRCTKSVTPTEQVNLFQTDLRWLR
jgi:hypothetical protein